MKKKILVFLLSLVFCFSAELPVFVVQAEGFASEYERVMDSAELLTDGEEAELSSKLREICERQKMDIAVITADTLDGKTPRDYADDTYDFCGFGYGEKKDGLLLLISTEENDWYISTHGYGITAFTDEGIKYIGKQIKDDLSNGNYAAAFDTFADLCDKFITQAKSGTPYDFFNLPREPLSGIWIPLSLLFGLLISLAVVKSMKVKLKTVRFQPAARDYLKNGSLNITEKRDMFLYNTVTRTERPKDSDSGGSSTHTSSSGETHGGGGGKF